MTPLVFREYKISEVVMVNKRLGICGMCLLLTKTVASTHLD